mgnify:FL=1|tara:strand:- start:438 stop:884 length:447 start_codon:yes stop_codon:yes gene_type:complete
MDKIIVFFSFFILFVSNSYAKTEYYLTLRNEKVNLRQGPSLDHPIKLVYKKKFLPVLVIDRSYNFRKIIDHENNSGWIHVSQLSKKKAALNNQESSIIFQKPSKYSKPLAVVEKGRLFLVKKCKNGWCKIKTENYSGWIMKQNLKGRL